MSIRVHSWLKRKAKMKTDNLPKWASYSKDRDIIVVDPEEVYPIYINKLGYDPNTLTQNQIECARRCFTEDLQINVGGFLRLHILKSEKGTFQLKKYKPGTPINWRKEYNRINKPTPTK